MVKKAFIILVLGLLLVGGVGLFYSFNDIEKVKNNMEDIYQGPVPVGYNLEHFRKTGETIKEVSS